MVAHLLRRSWLGFTVIVFFVLLFVVSSRYTVTTTAQAQPTPIPHPLPALSYRSGLDVPSQILPTVDVAVGIFTNNNRYYNPQWMTLTNLIANEFDMVTAISLFEEIRPCPPRWMVDVNAERDVEKYQFYNQKIVDNIIIGYPGVVGESPCHEPLERGLYGNDWGEYDFLATPNYNSIDKVVAWAKREQQRGHPVYVHVNSLLWDIGIEGVQPSWFRGDLMDNDEQYLNWTQNERKSILALMETHITGIIGRYCTPSLFLEPNPTFTPLPVGTPTPRPWEDTRLDGVVAVYEILNEVTDPNGTVRQVERDKGSYAWAIVNGLVTPNSSTYDPILDAAYPGLPTNYYVHQAALYADTVVENDCDDSTDIKPNISINNHFRVDLPLDGTNRDNTWARATLALIIDVNEGRTTNDYLIDTVGIQSHLWGIFDATPTATINPSATPTPNTTPIPENGSPDGLRSIIEAFNDIDVQVRITELDVSMYSGKKGEYFLPTPAAAYYPAQAAVFRDVIHQCLYDDNGVFVPICKEITFWVAFDTDEEYHRCYYATLFSPSNAIHPSCTFYPPSTPISTPTQIPTTGPSPTPTLTRTFTATSTSGPSPTLTPFSTFTPTPTINPSASATPTPTITRTPTAIPTFYIVKSAHREVYKELQIAPTPSTPTPGLTTPTATPTTIGAYPAPLGIPTPKPTANPYP